MITVEQVELKPALAKNGEKIRGEREVWIEGEQWAYIRVEHHGCHGPSFHLCYPHGGGTVTTANPDHDPSSKWSKARLPVRYHDIRSRSRKRDEPINPYTKLAEQIVALIASGDLESPAKREARFARHEAQRKREQREQLGRETLMRDALVSLYRRPDITNAERAGLAAVYETHFFGDIETIARQMEVQP